MKYVFLIGWFAFILLSAGCSSGYTIKEGAPIAHMTVSLNKLNRPSGVSGVFSGEGYRLELYDYDIGSCEYRDKLVTVNAFDLEETIVTPVGDPLYLHYAFFSSSGIFSTRIGSCGGLIAFYPEADHQYQFNFTIKKGTICSPEILDLTNINRPTRAIPVKIPKKCHDRVRGISN